LNDAAQEMILENGVFQVKGIKESLFSATLPSHHLGFFQPPISA
jgi:hypothetical protein